MPLCLSYTRPALPSTVAELRKLVREQHAAAGVRIGDRLDDLLVVLSELVTNAVAAGDQPVKVFVWQFPTAVGLDVWDRHPGDPQPRQVDGDATCGRGLAICEALADHVGVGWFLDWKVVSATFKVAKPAGVEVGAHAVPVVPAAA